MNEELRTRILGLRPREFQARVDYWRRGGLPAGGLAERVGGSRTAPLPHFDPTDERLNQAEVDYKQAVAGLLIAKNEGNDSRALGWVRKLERLEFQWLKPIVEPTAEMIKDLNALVSDAQSCLTCGDTKEAWVRRQRKKGVRSPIWRTKGSDCGKCYQAKRRARLDELQVIDPEPQVAASG